MHNKDFQESIPEKINILRILLVWALFILLAILNGAVRESILIPWLGKTTALPLSGVLLSCLIFLTTYLLFPFMKISARHAWQVGTIWLCLTVLFEFAFGHFAMGKPWQELLRAYDVQGGNLWVVVLFVILVSPWLASRIKGKVYR